MAETPEQETPQLPPTKIQEQKHKPPETLTSTPDPSKPLNPLRTLFTFIIILLLLVGIVFLTLYLIYRPHKPHFTVVGAAIYDLNMSSLPLLSTTLQFTILARNPNKRASIYYDRLSVFVSYRNQQITPRVILPPLYQVEKSTVAMSPVIGGGEAVEVAAEVAYGLQRDEAFGVVALRVVLVGRLSWKVGGKVRTGRYGVYVKCDVLMGLKNGFVGQVPLLASPDCNVRV